MNRIQIFLAIVILTMIVGCSSGQSPVAPDTGLELVAQNSEYKSNRTIWGYWTIRIDPESESVEIVPDRGAGSHFNVVRLLEVSPCTHCLSISNLSWLPNNIVQCDFNLTHPFPGLIKFTGFDVRGVLVTDGDTLFPGSNRFISLDGSNPTLVNPDGFTNLFNPVEFPPGSAQWPILEYIPGKFAIGDDFTGTLNPFMAFCMDNPRRMFEAGATEKVTINLKYPSLPFEFGYVVDASWIKVDDVIDPVTDFPPEANCLEPYRLEFRMSTELTNVIGDSALIQIEIFDHQGVDTISTVSIECPSLFDGEVVLSYSSQSGDDSWLFDGVITNQFGVDNGQYPSLIKAASNESDANLGELAAYQIDDIRVSNDGSLIWAIRAGGTNHDRGHGITTLSDDSTVVTGSFHDSATFGEGEANETVLVSDGEYDIFVARYNPDGTLAWVKRAGGTGPDIGWGITTLSDDSTVVTGYFWDSATFGEGEANETVLVSVGGCDIFVARYNPDGTLAWAKSAGGTYYNDEGFSITTLSDNSTVVTGHFSDSATFGKDEANESVLVSDGEYDIFVARYNPDGTLIWAKRAGGTNYERGYGITTLSDDSTVVTGWFRDSATFGKGEANETVLLCDGNYDIFVARYNPDGTLAWAIRAGGTDSDRGYGITTLSDDSTVVTGDFNNPGFINKPATFGEGEANETVLVSGGWNDIFVARYNADGTLAWAKRSGGPSHDESYGITTLSDDSTIVTGHYFDSTTFGEGEVNETVLLCDGKYDIFVARHNPDSTLAWAKSAGGTDSDEGLGITTLSDDSTVVTGWFEESATFGQDEPNETVLVSDGERDIFMARYYPDGTLVWAKRAGGTDRDVGSGITTLSDDSTVVTGRFSESATFGEGEANETILVSTGWGDIFVARYNPDCSLAWAKRAGGIGGMGVNDNSGAGITTLSDDSTIVTGLFNKSATFGEGEPNETVLDSDGYWDIFVARFAP